MKYIIILLLFSQAFVGQSTIKIKKSKLVYIYFNHGEFQNILTENLNSFKILNEKQVYEIRFDKKSFFSFSEREFSDIEDAIKNKKMIRKWVNKSFLKKNKNITIDINFIKKFGIEKTYFLIGHKQLFLIDSKEKSCDSILIKEVVWSNTSYRYNE